MAISSPQHSDNIVCALRQHHANGFDLVDAGVGTVEQAGVRIKTNLSVHPPDQFIGNFLAFAAANPAFHYRCHL